MGCFIERHPRIVKTNTASMHQYESLKNDMSTKNGKMNRDRKRVRVATQSQEHLTSWLKTLNLGTTASLRVSEKWCEHKK